MSGAAARRGSRLTIPRSSSGRRWSPARRSRACAVPAGRSQPAPAGAPRDALGAERIEPLLAYIAQAWRPLTRTAADLPRAAEDAKIAHAPGAPWPVYLPPEEDRDAVAAALARVLPAHELARSRCSRCRPSCPRIFEHGLLYLPRPYVVPGGRFNEMYGWDSYFIVLGLLRDGRADARARHGRRLRLRGRATTAACSTPTGPTT